MDVWLGQVRHCNGQAWPTRIMLFRASHVAHLTTTKCEYQWSSRKFRQGHDNRFKSIYAVWNATICWSPSTATVFLFKINRFASSNFATAIQLLWIFFLVTWLPSNHSIWQLSAVFIDWICKFCSKIEWAVRITVNAKKPSSDNFANFRNPTDTVQYLSRSNRSIGQGQVTTTERA